MSFPKYPEYKDSGVEWLGEVPAHWALIPIKHLASLNPRKSDFRIDTQLLCSFVPMEKLKTGVLLLDEERQIKEVINGYTYFEDGDVLQAKVTPCFENKNIAIASGLTNGIGFGSSEINVLRPHHWMKAEYLYYRLQEDNYMDFCTSSMMGAGGLKRVPTDVINNFTIAAPGVAEQTQIARFLDHETARIDALIEEQQRLIELLKEKRQAVISHAVTKGLDPTVPMKDSGVEWLGEVPAHWALRPLKYQCRFSGGGTPSKDNLEYWNGDIPWVSPKDMKRFWLSDTEDKITELAIQESSANLVKPGALLMVVRSGILQRTIPVAINTVPVTLNQDMKALIFDGERTAEFVAFFISGFERPILQAWRKQGATVESIEHEYVANTMLPIPPKEELVGIVNAMRAVEVKFDSLSSESACLIRKLQERRSALISAAVTGKIDVRNWQPPAGQYPAGDTRNRTEPEVV